MNVAVPSLGLTAAVFPVRVERSGTVAIPADVATAGWVVTTSRPGMSGGTATLVGHVDDATGRYGVFHRLYAAKVGQQVTVRASTGEALRYVVRAVRLYPRDGLPGDLFASTGSPRLALVTCAGAYNRAHGGFPDNLVVWATPA